MLVVLGNACRDITYRVKTLPKPGETVIANHIAFDLGGKGFNQAIAARRAGQPVRFVAAIGSDFVAQEIRKSLALEGIDPANLIAHDGQSDSSVILVDAKGENVIVSDTSRAEALRPDDILPRLKLKAEDTLLLQGNLSRETTEAAIATAGQAGTAIILNAAPFSHGLPAISNVIDVLVVNELEAHLWAGLDESHSLKNVMEAIGVSMVIVTLGGKGCRFRDAKGNATAIRAPLVNAIDTTCSGDVFTGTFAGEWIVSRDNLQAASLAVYVASDKVTRQGSFSAFPTAGAVSRLKKQCESSSHDREWPPFEGV